MPFKATAGLHRSPPTGGTFLNVIAACAFGERAALTGRVELDADALRWRDREAGPEVLARVRREQLVAVGQLLFLRAGRRLGRLGIL